MKRINCICRFSSEHLERVIAPCRWSVVRGRALGDATAIRAEVQGRQSSAPNRPALDGPRRRGASYTSAFDGIGLARTLPRKPPTDQCSRRDMAESAAPEPPAI